MTEAIRVLIADDQQLVRAGFRLILERQPDIEVVGEAASGAEAVSATRALHPDVVLMDIRMPDLDGIAAARQILAGASGADTKIVILTTFDLDEYVYEALKVGASGFLLKDTPPERLVTAVRSVSADDALLSPAITRRLIETFTQAGDPGRSRDALRLLSGREAAVFDRLARGLTNLEIATELVVAESTVKTHVARILDKLHLRDRVQAVVFAYESGIVSPGRSTDGR